MKCNMLPKAERDRMAEMQKQRIFAPLVCLLSLAVLGSAVFSLWCYATAQGARQYVTDFAYPVAQQIKAHNARDSEAKAYQQRLQEAQRTGMHWSALLVALAETKPPDLSVQSLAGEGQTVTITATGTHIDTARSWQQTLRRRDTMQDVQLKTMKHDGTGPKQFVLALTMGETEHGTTTAHPE